MPSGIMTYEDAERGRDQGRRRRARSWAEDLKRKSQNSPYQVAIADESRSFLSCETGHGKMLTELLVSSVAIPTVSDVLEKKFIRLRDEWKSRKSHSSSVESHILHPAYLRIIGMGVDALPFIFAELDAKRLDHWFPALQAITEASPVPERDEGRISKMAEAWVEWGKQNGYYRSPNAL